MLESLYFLEGVGKLLIFSAVLALLAMAFVSLAKFLGSVMGAGSSTTSSEETVNGGCFFGVILLLALGGLTFGAKYAYTAITADCLSEDRTLARETYQESGPISVLQKHYGLLYRHYEDLQEDVAAKKAQCSSLRQEMANMSGAAARNTVRQRISELEKAQAGNKQMINGIEELAAKLYFARYLENLGLKVNQSELEQEIGLAEKKVEKK